MCRIIKYLIVFTIGCLTYGFLEVVCRGYTFISMGLIGGICMVVLHLLNDERRNGMGTGTAVIISALFILSIEFFSGELLNRTFKLHIWSYEQMPLNFDGQICLLYGILWLGLSFVGIVFDEFIRLKVLREKNYPILVSKRSKA